MGPEVVIVAGPSGSGKTTVAAALAQALAAALVDADDLHPPANVAKMSAGQALDDDDRRPWLAAVRAVIDARLAEGTTTVVACSALRRQHRALLGAGRPGVQLVWLDVPAPELAGRLAARPGHFFPARLLESQLAAQERPAPGEGALVVAADRTVAVVVDEIVAGLSRGDGSGPGRKG